MYDRMVFRMFAAPALLVLGAAIAAIVFRWWIPSRLSHQPLMSALVEASHQAATYVPAGLLLWSGILAFGQLLELWQWRAGRADSCHHCGGAVRLQEGRWGFYFRCYACGRTRRA